MGPQRIEKLHMVGFTAFANAELSLGPFNVLIGPNGAGKSALLSLLRLLRSASHGELQVFIARAGGADDVLRRAEPPTQRLEVACELLTTTGRSHYLLVAERTEANALMIRSERMERFELDGRPCGIELHDHPRSESAFGDVTRWGSEYKLFSQFRHFHFAQTTATLMGLHECDLEDNQQLREDGGNLAAFLYLLEQRHPIAYRRILGSIRHIFAEFGGFSLQPSPLNPQRIRLRWRRKGMDEDVGVHQLSDGTLRYMLLATLLLQPRALLPPIIAVDEPELGLHPAALNIMTGLLQAASHQAQIIVATQSPALVDALAPEDVVVVNRRDGVSTFERLAEEPLRDWLQDYTLGQLWEKNVIGGGPFA